MSDQPEVPTPVLLINGLRKRKHQVIHLLVTVRTAKYSTLKDHLAGEKHQHFANDDSKDR